MAECGIFAIIRDDHIYPHHHRYEMRPSVGLQQLTEEAADVAYQDDWDELAKSWTRQEHICSPDEFDEALALSRRLESESQEGPSWRKAAEDRQALPQWKLGFVHEWMAVADLDNRELVLFDCWPDGPMPSPVPFAVASLDDGEGLQALAEQLAEMPDGHGAHPAVVTQRSWEWPERARSTYVTQRSRDWPVPPGQWRRPPGRAPHENTPDDYPALRYDEWEPPSWNPREHQSDTALSVADGEFAEYASRATRSSEQMGRCRHVGKRSGVQCIRPAHGDKHHRYS